MSVYAVGRNMQRLMKERHISTKQFAKELDVSEPSVKKWLFMGKIPNGYALYKMAKLFKVPMEDIMEGVDEENDFY